MPNLSIIEKCGDALPWRVVWLASSRDIMSQFYGLKSRSLLIAAFLTKADATAYVVAFENSNTKEEA